LGIFLFYITPTSTLEQPYNFLDHGIVEIL
jgi:hypothetical protein